MQKPIIVLRVAWRQFRLVNVLALSVYESMLNNNNFINPQPTLVKIKSAMDLLTEMMEKWGDTGNRGSHNDHLQVMLRSQQLHYLLAQLAAWCMSSLDPALSYDEQAVLLGTTGFPLKRPRTPVGKLEMVQNLRRIIARNVHDDQVKLRWVKPLAVALTTNVKNYTVFRSDKNSFSSAVPIASVPHTVYIDEPGEGVWYYWVLASNNKGYGVECSSLKVRVAVM